MSDADIIRQIGAVLLVFALLGAAVWLLSRRRATGWLLNATLTRNAGHMEVVDRLRLTPQQSLQLVRVGRRGFLIAVQATGCSLLEARPIDEFGCEDGRR